MASQQQIAIGNAFVHRVASIRIRLENVPRLDPVKLQARLAHGLKDFFDWHAARIIVNYAANCPNPSSYDITYPDVAVDGCRLTDADILAEMRAIEHDLHHALDIRNSLELIADD